MGYTATIKDTETGQLAYCYFGWPWRREGTTDEFWWSEGNQSCDCNRSLAFGYDESMPCNAGKNRFVVTEIKSDQGESLYQEDDDGTVTYAVYE